MIMRAGTAMAERIAVIREPTAMRAQITNPTMNVRMISLKAAFLAFPECFMSPQGKAYETGVKGKV
jgi:hypothetical protein